MSIGEIRGYWESSKIQLTIFVNNLLDLINRYVYYNNNNINQNRDTLINSGENQNINQKYRDNNRNKNQIQDLSMDS